MPNKTRRNYMISDEGHRLLKLLARSYGVSMSAMIEILVREKADEEGIERQTAETVQEHKPVI